MRGPTSRLFVVVDVSWSMLASQATGGAALVARAAELGGGGVIGESSRQAVADAVRTAVGVGETLARTESSDRSRSCRG